MDVLLIVAGALVLAFVIGIVAVNLFLITFIGSVSEASKFSVKKDGEK